MHLTQISMDDQLLAKLEQLNNNKKYLLFNALGQNYTPSVLRVLPDVKAELDGL